MKLVELLTRPRIRGDCANVPRPCPFVSCRYHLYLDLHSRRPDGLVVNFPNKEPGELEHSCALDVAEEGEHSQKEIAKILETSYQAIQQAEDRALEKVTRRWPKERADIAAQLKRAAKGERG